LCFPERPSFASGLSPHRSQGGIIGDRDRAEHQRLIFSSQRARDESNALIASAREALARAAVLIQLHHTQGATEPAADLVVDGIPNYTCVVPSERDNDAERFARIEALMEEYRVKHEDLEAYVESARGRAKNARDAARELADTARVNRTTRTRHH
jgi:hypothetical protein